MLNNFIKIILFLMIPLTVFGNGIILSFNKKTNKMTLLRNNKKVKDFNFSYGKKKGKKTQLKDLKTPEGSYRITKVYSKDFMVKYFKNYKMYGSLALVLNYPNKEDKEKGYTGSGIWIHGTDYTYRLGYKNITRGCLLMSNEDISKIYSMIEDYEKVIVNIE